MPKMSKSRQKPKLGQKNTRTHWALYALDMWESKNGRDDGATPDDIYQLVGGEDSIVFTSRADAGSALRQAHKKNYTQRRSIEGDWDQPLLIGYRLVDSGAKALKNAGKPEKLPNRQRENYDRELPVEPEHEPRGVLLTEMDEEDVEDDWLRTESPDDWESTEFDNVYFRDKADAQPATLQRSGGNVEKAAGTIGEAYHEWDIVVTRGPWRQHDVMYRADPETKRIHLDYYSIRPGTDHSEDVIVDITRSLKQAKQRGEGQ